MTVPSTGLMPIVVKDFHGASLSLSLPASATAQDVCHGIDVATCNTINRLLGPPVLGAGGAPTHIAHGIGANEPIREYLAHHDFLMCTSRMLLKEEGMEQMKLLEPSHKECQYFDIAENGSRGEPQG